MHITSIIFTLATYLFHNIPILINTSPTIYGAPPVVIHFPYLNNIRFDK